MDMEKLRTWALIATVYLLAVFAPIIIMDPVTPPMPAFWVFIGIGFTFVTYNNVMSWRRGDRGPLVIRTLIPLSLLSISLLLFWAGIWNRMLLGVHSIH
ncbi:MAG TPA: hypothetical protein VGL50_02145 [Steroidobacteraceae bacterium]|jgi:hypothetical protein